MTTSEPSFPAVDRELAQRLERAEALACVAYVEARQRLQPSVGAASVCIAGAHAIFDGPASPLTQTFGLGVFDQLGREEWKALESHFQSRGATVAHEVSSFATPETWGQLSARGYSPIEASTVLLRPTAEPLRDAPAASGALHVRQARGAELATWCRVMSEGLRAESAELEATVADLTPVMAAARGSHCFLAYWESEPIAAALLNVQEAGVAVLGGACTLPWARRRGAQTALLRVRLELGASRGASWAMVAAGPGSGSQRNAERQGFRPVYVRSKWAQPARESR
jgi:hypothetical protein